MNCWNNIFLNGWDWGGNESYNLNYCKNFY